ncbi:glycosyltransferase family 39 protein [Roseimarinus sediminis]|uniref:glycosyltransferase family 39 protein n=1 Tax=Roseimarinus sediminis TaxID=1610899 RepID=UPI003D1B32E4
MKKYYSDTSAILIIVLLGVLFQKNYINDFPSHIHAWSQSDRYALALGYVNNDLNFFKPETFSLLKNSKNIADWKYPSQESITAVDFPIHDYIPAIFMKITGDSSPRLFRLYILLYGFAGLFFLYRLSYLWTKSSYRSIFIMIFAATSPVFVYYQGGFLPTIPSLSNAIIGIFFFSKYLFTPEQKYFNLSLLFLTIAALARTTFVIPLIALFGLEILRIFKKDAKLMPKLIPVLVSVLIILFYFFYNKFLTEKYGSIFLSNILPARSFEEAVEIIKLIKKKWSTQYFSSVHYIILALSFVGAIYFLISKKQSLQKQKSLFALLIAIIFIGCIAFSILMFRQFVNHDYYFLDTFFLPIILLLIITLSIFPIKNNILMNRLSMFAILFICIPFIVYATKSQKERRISGYWDRTTATINNFENSEHFLDSIGIPGNAKMLVIDAYATNIPLILMNRKGYPIIKTKKEYISKSLEWDYDYIVLQNEFFLSDVYSVYPEIITKITKIADNGNLSICTHSDSILDQTLTGFLGFDDQSPVFESIMTYDDTIRDNLWKNTQSTSELSYSGNNCGILSRDMKYGLTFKTHQLEALTQSKRTMLLSSFFRSDGANDCGIVVSISENGKNTYYKTFNLQKLLTKQGEWEKVNLIFQLPKITSEDYEFGLYIVLAP